MSLQKRVCGECTACCWYPDVHDDDNNIISRARELCSYCEEKVGCSIYAKRPMVCREFSCLWLTGCFSEEHRPDKLGVVVDIRPVPDGYETIFLYFREVCAGALEKTEVKNLIKSMQKGRFLIVTIGLDGSQFPYKPEEMSEEDSIIFLEATFAYWRNLALEQGIKTD